MKVRFNIYISLISIEPLQQLALKLGYVHDRGPSKGQGNVSAMIEALAQNELQISRRKDTRHLGNVVLAGDGSTREAG